MSRAEGGTQLGEHEPNGTPRSLTTTVLRGAGIGALGYALAQMISFASYLVLAHLLAPSEFGVFAAAIVVVGVGQVVGESGMLAALIQRREQVEAALESAFVATLLAGLLLSLLALAAAPLVGLFFHSRKVALVAAVMSASMLPRLAAIVPDALLQRRFSFLRRVAIDPVGMLAFAVGSVTCAVAGLGVWSLVVGTYSQLAFDVLAAWRFAGWRPHPRRASVRVWRELASFGRPVIIAEVIRRATSELPVIALGRFAGAGAIGQYSYAQRVSSQPPGAVVGIGAYVLFPALARLAGGDERRFRAALTRALRWMCATSFPLGMLLAALGTPAIVLVFGARWHAAGDAVIPLGVYAATIAFDSLGSEVWKAAGRPDMLPRMHGLSLVLMAALIFALVVPFGLMGVAVAIALSGLGVGVYAVRGIHRVSGASLETLLAEIRPAAVAAIAVGTGLFCLEHLVVHSATRGAVPGLALLAGETVLGAGVYLACLSALSPAVRADLTAAVGGLKRRAPLGDPRAHIVTFVEGLRGGAEQMALNIALRLDPARFRTTICVTRRRPAAYQDGPLLETLGEDASAAGARVIVLPRRRAFHVWPWWQLIRTLWKDPPDVIHGHMFGSSLWAVMLAPLLGTRSVIAHHHGQSTRRRPWAERLLARHMVATRSALVVAVSQESAQRIMHEDGFEPSRVRVVHNGVSETGPGDGTKIRRTFDIADDEPVIICVSRLRSAKAVHVLVEAAALLRPRFPRAQILIAGDGEERERLTALVAEHDLRGVRLLGERADIPDLLAAADLAVLPSDYEGMPLAVLEYMFAGLPTVATRVGGIPELIEHGVNGLLVPPRDPESLAKAMASLLADPVCAREMGAAARARAEREFSLDRSVEEVQVIYGELLRRGHSAAVGRRARREPVKVGIGD